MSSGLYIPPRGIGFRIVGYVSQQVIYSRNSPDPQVGQVAVDRVYSDQTFELIHGTGKHAGLYAIKGRKSDKVLFSRSTDPNIGHVGGNGTYEDNWFEIKPASGEYKGYFQLITPSQKRVMFSRTTKSPYLWNHPAPSSYSDQYFTFLFEDMKIDRIEYDLKLGKILSSTPLVIANQTLVNDTDHDQEMEFTLNETVTHTSSFEYTFGITVSAGATFKAGVPLIAEAEFTVSTEISNEFTWGTEESFSQSYTARFPVMASPYTKVRAVSTVNKGVLEVPYTMYLSSKSTGATTESKGIWRGVSTWDLRHTISNFRIGDTDEEDPIDQPGQADEE